MNSKSTSLYLSEKGGLLTFLLASVLFLFFFGYLLSDLNNYFFSAWGDGVQSYTSIVYHAKWDKTAFYSSGMQYPYGDNYYFSVNPALLPTLIQKLNLLFPIADYTIGIFNFTVIISPVIASIFLYLIFRTLNISQNYAAVFSVLISFISPQLFRIPGHNSLGYIFAIPAMLYFVMIFYNRPTWLKTVVIMIFVFVMSSTHLYYFAFFGLITLPYYLILLLTEKASFGRYRKFALHGFFQIIFPYLIMSLIIKFVDHSDFRSFYPWGFFASFSSISGILFPFNSFYEKFFLVFMSPGFYTWEGISYIGLPAAFCFLYILFCFIQNCFYKRYHAAWNISNNKQLTILFWISIFSLLLSFGFPFWGDFGKSMYQYSGIYKQVRAIGRFAWVFYYVINIVACYKIYFWYMSSKKTYKILILVALFAIQITDVLWYANRSSKYNNKIEEFSDKANKDTLNTWINRHDLTVYQAIIGLPYFHNGSDNIVMERDCSGMRDAMIYSIKTGLPTVNSHMCRTPIDETIKNVGLAMEAYRPYEFLKDLPNHKPFLLLWRKECKLNAIETKLLSVATLIDSNINCYFYTITYKNIISLTDSLYQKTKVKISKEKFNFKENHFSTDTSNMILNYHFDTENADRSYLGGGARQHPCQYPLTFFEENLPKNNSGTDMVISFWLGNIDQDLIPRGLFETMLVDQQGRVYETTVRQIGKELKIIDKSWGLIEYKVKLNNPQDRIKLTVWNTEIKGKFNIVDELLIRPENVSNYYYKADTLVYNNRYYTK